MSDRVRLFLELRDDTVAGDGCEDDNNSPDKEVSSLPSGPVEASSPGSRIGWFLVSGLKQKVSIEKGNTKACTIPLKDEISLPESDVEGDLKQAVVQPVVEVVRL